MNIGGALHKIMGNRWLQGYFVAKSVEEMISGSLGTGLDLAQDAASKDPDTFQRAGYGAGGVVSAGANLALMDMPWLIHGIRRENAMHEEAFQFVKNKYTGATANYAKVNNELFHIGASGNAASKIVGREAEEIMSKGAKGIISKKGMFLKNAGWKFNVGTMLGPMVVGMAASTLLGFGGKLMDEMSQLQRKEREMHYDNRYIVNQQQDMNTLQQVGAAMDSYQNRMLSLGRIYHSR